MIKRLIWRIKYILFIIIGSVFLFSCEKETDSLNAVYLQDYRLLNAYSPDQVKGSLQFAALLYPEFDTLIASSEYGVSIYKVVYKTNLLGEELNASGLVVFPQGDGSFPLVSFQNGTNTCHYYAPSENPDDQFYTLLSMLAGSGYIIAIPDYIGFGESDYILHPYMHRESSNDAIIDLLKATQELIQQEITESKLNGDLYLMGYSQGGWAAMSVLNELETYPIFGIDPKAAICGAGAYNLTDMASYIFKQEEYPNPFFLPYFVESRSQLGMISDNLELYFQEPYASKVTNLFNGDKCNREMNAEFTTTVNELLTSKLVEEFEDGDDFIPLREQLQQNSIPTWNPNAKIRLYHSMGDKSIPYGQSVNLFNKLIQSGMLEEKIQLEIVQNDTLDHGDAILPWGIDAINYLQSLQP